MPWACHNSGSWGGHSIGPGHFAEKGFHFSSGQERDENPAACFTNKGPKMRNRTWCQQRITWLEVETFQSYLALELAFEDIEPFILVEMQVTWLTTSRHEGVLKDEDIA